jgi:hypothetical protein
VEGSYPYLGIATYLIARCFFKKSRTPPYGISYPLVQGAKAGFRASIGLLVARQSDQSLVPPGLWDRNPERSVESKAPLAGLRYGAAPGVLRSDILFGCLLLCQSLEWMNQPVSIRTPPYLGKMPVSVRIRTSALSPAIGRFTSPPGPQSS